MLIRNLKHKSDYKQAVDAQKYLLDVAVANERKLAEARKGGLQTDFDESKPLSGEDLISKEALIEDKQRQRQMAHNNILKLGFSFQDATGIINQLSDVECLLINKTYTTMYKQLKDVYNVKLMDVDDFVLWFRQYSADIDSSKGITLGNPTKLDRINASIAGLRNDIPTKTEFNTAIRWIGTQFGTSGRRQREIIDTLKLIQDALPTSEEEWESIGEANEEMLADILAAAKKVPSSEQIQEVITSPNASIDDAENLVSQLTARDIAALQRSRRYLFAFAEKPSEAVNYSSFYHFGVDDKLDYLHKLQRNGYIPESVNVDSLTYKQANEIYRQFLNEHVDNTFHSPLTSPTATPALKKEGSGLKADDVPKYKELGKYVILWRQLINKDILNVKYKSLGAIPSIKPQAISDVFKQFIIDLMKKGKMNHKLYKEVPAEERMLFERIAVGAQVADHLKLKKTYVDKDAADIQRFEVLRGEFLGGNNNKDVVRELKAYIIKFMKSGKIHKTEGKHLLEMLE